MQLVQSFLSLRNLMTLSRLSGEKGSLYPEPEPARHPYRNPLRYCRNESPVLQLSHETAGAELVQRKNGVHGLGTDCPEE